MENGELTVEYTDTGVVYAVGERKFIADGEYDGGEAWVGDTQYYYERSGDNVVLTAVDTGETVYTFEDSEDGWAAFAQAVLVG